jgi:hypothetical protein
MSRTIHHQMGQLLAADILSGRTPHAMPVGDAGALISSFMAGFDAVWPAAVAGRVDLAVGSLLRSATAGRRGFGPGRPKLNTRS